MIILYSFLLFIFSLANYWVTICMPFILSNFFVLFNCALTSLSCDTAFSKNSLKVKFSCTSYLLTSVRLLEFSYYSSNYALTASSDCFNYLLAFVVFRSYYVSFTLLIASLEHSYYLTLSLIGSSSGWSLGAG